jgi:hypothetical protein
LNCAGDLSAVLQFNDNRLVAQLHQETNELHFAERRG